MPDLGYYIQLIPSWNSDKPRFVNTLAALLQPMADAQAMLEKLNADFDIDTAIGVQLDQVGQWVGNSRWVMVPITDVYFAFDWEDQHVGFDQGVWFRPYDPVIGTKPLDDETYRKVLQFKAVANEWDGTTPSIVAALDQLFPDIAVNDLGDKRDGLMSEEVLLPSSLSDLMIAVLVQDFFIKPGGVRCNFYVSTAVGKPIFGFDVVWTETKHTAIAGFDLAAWGRYVTTT